ncbi:hypothetical protein A3A79_04780 [Candidatus Gottesmanbacteria bacterium RIFCSPLOWO2_01_FULL_43_11b]|uniref:Glycosyltransferase RgtA/B/C/D-like domain-containing protein n=1 Tax=Candidatus Gottesmanbacteria bacterium RIFCSPLOWO2_01_FULL_43_11b TaxID=1798392 RepID=A0A1F6AIC0_9BACT|nr:MAG: hypothetical protein A3A79_04780 [Candidatus Gottesmanbacteria bacterium RIFCSPLOWO2_01_FULL_43_11b]
MRKHWNNIKPILFLYVGWLLLLILVQKIAPTLFSLQRDFLGPISWANFDGVHYLNIAKAGYRQYLEAFFPLYPMLIGNSGPIFALIISHISFFIGLLFLKMIGEQKSLPLILLFPTSFFFAAVYPESLYLGLAAGTLYALSKQKWGLVGVLGMLASATKIFGVYLLIPAILEYIPTKKKRARDMIAIGLIPLGLVGFMVYLWRKMGDPLAFFHVQPIFGANRSGGELIFLPQVLWRYIKIFITANPATFQYSVAVLEFVAFVFSVYLLFVAWKKIRKPYFWYSLAVIITPTLTGTLSSFPRYLLAAFPLFFVINTFPKKIKYVFTVIFILLFVYFASAFLRGYFVA